MISRNIQLVGFFMMVVVGLVAGLSLGRTSHRPASSRSEVYSRVEQVRQVRHLRLVTYHFETMMEVAHEEKTGRVYLLLVVPSRISCYLDLEQLSYRVTDSLLYLELPEPVLEEPVLELDSARIFNLNRRYISLSRQTYETVVRNLQRSLTQAKADVTRRAEVNGIRRETTRLGEAYFRNLFGGMGYGVVMDGDGSWLMGHG